MNKGISEIEKFKIIRPMLGNHKHDAMRMPIIKRILPSEVDFEYLRPLGFSNLSLKHNNEDVLSLMFNYDDRLKRLWNAPMNYIPLLSTVYATLTPDFSAYPFMEYWELAHSIFKSRYLGCLWQVYGIKTIPTISWALPDTYDVCFSGVEKGSIVAVSTVGCADYIEAFSDGYREMMQRLEPSVVIVYGGMLPGVYGNVFHIDFTDAFNKSKDVYKQQSLFKVSPIVKIEGVY